MKELFLFTLLFCTTSIMFGQINTSTLTNAEIGNYACAKQTGEGHISNQSQKSQENEAYMRQDKIVSNITSNSGKDFSYFFNQINLLSNTTYSSDVTISENYRNDNKSTEISIHSKSRLIYKFRTLEKKDYLYAAAQESIKRLKMFYLDEGISFAE